MNAVTRIRVYAFLMGRVRERWLHIRGKKKLRQTRKLGEYLQRRLER